MSTNTENTTAIRSLFYRADSDVAKAHPDDVGFDISPVSLKIVFCDGEKATIDCTVSSAEFDRLLFAAIEENKKRSFWKIGRQKGIRKLIFDSGVAIEPYPDFWMMACANSRVCKTNSLVLQNGVGIIDPGYRGNVKFIYLNTDFSYDITEDICILRKTCGQLIPIPYLNPQAIPSTTLNETARGAGGFGSTSKD